MSSYFSVYKYWANIDKFQLDKGRGVIKAVELWGLVLTFWSQVNEVRLRQWQIFLEDLLSSRYSFRDWGCSSEKKKKSLPYMSYIFMLFLSYFPPDGTCAECFTDVISCSFCKHIIPISETKVLRHRMVGLFSWSFQGPRGSLR